MNPLSILCLVLVFVIIALIFQVRKLRMRQHEMEEQARAKDEIFSLIGHNLRGPLSVTEGLQSIVDDYIDGGELEEIRETFHELDSYLTRLRALVEKLLTYAFSQSPRDNLNIESLDIAAIVKELIGYFFPMLKAKGLTIKQSLETGKVKADSVVLSAALGTVLENAIRFSPPGSEIHISGKKDVKDQYWLEVEDSGPGFEDASKAFTFSRETIGSDTEGVKSVGIGLIAAQSWLKAIGAAIFISKNKSNGAGVTITIPLPS